MADRPGVMLYFDALRPALKRLDDAQCGRLLRAVMDYAEHGVLPELDAMTGLAFDLLVPKIDRDAEQYAESCEQRQYAAYSREAKRRGEQPIGMPEWKLRRVSETTTRYGSPRAVTVDTVPSPTTSTSPSSSTAVTTSTSPSSSTAVTTSTSPSINTSADATGEGFKGEGEHDRLFREWLSAMDEGDRTRACTLSSRLYALGFNVNINSRELKRLK